MLGEGLTTKGHEGTFSSIFIVVVVKLQYDCQNLQNCILKRMDITVYKSYFNKQMTKKLMRTGIESQM